MDFSKEAFGKNFHWGVSTAAYQIEGAHNVDGKGPSIWDIFTAQKGKIYNNQNANTTCNFYNLYPKDVILMHLMGIPNYRFSLSWSRLIPKGTGQINYKGVDYYNRLIDFCLQHEIEPWVTLYHWDLPYELEKKGGWTNREIISWFSDYVSFCIKTFGDRVKHWMMLNEPMVFIGAGYFMGIHAPGRKGLSNFLAALHHAAICQAESGRIVKSLNSSLKTGTTFSCSHIEPFSNKEPDIIAAQKADALLNRIMIEPLLGFGYPVKNLRVLQRMEQFIKDGDEDKLKFQMDFIGIQNYTREIVRYAYFVPFIKAKIIKAKQRKVLRTQMNWEVYPSSIYYILKKFSAYPEVKELIITENGAAFPDTFTNGKINDAERKTFIQQHIQQVLKARCEGVNVNGYFIWSFTDNFEWAEGYYPKFGLVHVDFKTQQRIIKSSGQWYSNFLNGITSCS